jgi:hypothetical protein
MASEPTVRGLDELRARLSASIDATNARADGLRHELAGSIDEPSRRMIEAEIGTSTALAGLAGAVRDVVTVLREQA